MRRVARQTFGFERLRPEQESGIHALLEGRDTMAVMPTGAGKSAIYQIAGLLMPGPTVVVSPLIALQQDQVEHLHSIDAPSASLNSSLGRRDRRKALQDLAARHLDFILMAPEQFQSEATVQQLQVAAPSLFVVDEAHCIDQWGDDFRPDYLRLGAVIEALGHPVVLALTATASPRVRNGIVEHLGLRDPHLVIQGFDRPNIWLGVEHFHEEDVKRQAVLERVRESAFPGIVYVATRKHAEELATALLERGTRAAHYHAGMKPAERGDTQRRFMDGELDVIVATNAFGLGVDKPNVRFVFHLDISDSVDSYYQEIGRAGRDGAPAKAVLFYRPGDIALHQFFAGAGQVDASHFGQVVSALQEENQPLDTTRLQAMTDLSETKVIRAVTRLEEVGAVETLATGEVTALPTLTEPQILTEEAVEAEKLHRQADRSRIEMMQNYAELMDCRRRFLLNYFGEAQDEPCHNCDNCAAGVLADETGDQPFPMHSRVAHTVLGSGSVQRYEGDKVVVLFDDVGYKTLLVDYLVETKALQLVG